MIFIARPISATLGLALTAIVVGLDNIPAVAKEAGGDVPGMTVRFPACPPLRQALLLARCSQNEEIGVCPCRPSSAASPLPDGTMSPSAELKMSYRMEEPLRSPPSFRKENAMKTKTFILGSMALFAQA